MGLVRRSRRGAGLVPGSPTPGEHQAVAPQGYKRLQAGWVSA